MRALVTGSTGFVGRHLVDYLRENRVRVTCLVRPGSDISVLRDSEVQLVSADYQKEGELEKHLERYDWVFHAAGVINARDWDTYARANILYTRRLLQALKGTGRPPGKFIFISSISASGPSGPGTFRDEADSPRPVSNYGRSKLEAEKLVGKHAAEFPVVILRPPNIIGPLQHELYQAIRLLKRRIFPLVGNGTIQTSICYIKDLVEICLEVARRKEIKNDIYFVTYPKAYAWRDITREVSRQLHEGGFYLKIPYPVQFLAAAISEFFSWLTGKPALVTRENLKMSRDYYWLYSGRKLKEELGLVPDTDLEKAIGETLAYYRRKGKV